MGLAGTLTFFLSMFNFFTDIKTWFFARDHSILADEYIDLHLIRYTQNSIKRNFQDGTPLSEVIRQLKNGTIRPKNFPPIKVFRWENRRGVACIHSEDNRRLYCYQEARRFNSVPVIWVTPNWDANKYTTNNQGRSIRLR